MLTRARILMTSLLVLLLSGSIAFAQDYGSGRRAFTQPELDQILAPIALYPDALLSQILMASTYPLEIVEAARWSVRNPGLDGDLAVRAVERADWDPSVKSLVAFPQILALMDERLDWTQRLGDAFLAQPAEVMDSVQYLRQKAYLAGNLQSTEQFRVAKQGPAFVIDFANSEFFYLPYYDPTMVYGTWWWPAYQPVRWAAWSGYYLRPGFAWGYAWGPTIQVSRNFFFGAPDWQRRSLNIVNVNNYYYNPPHLQPRTEIARGPAKVWQHNPAHHRHTPARDPVVHQPSGQPSAAPAPTRDVRTAPALEVRAGSGNRPDARGEHASPSAAQVRPAVATLGAGPNVERAPGSSHAPAIAAQSQRRTAPGSPNVPALAAQPEMRSAPSRPNPAGAGNRPNVEQRPAAVEGVSRAPNARNSSARRPGSQQAAAAGDSAVPESQASANVVARIASSDASAPQPAGNPRGNGGAPRRQ